MRPNVMEGVPEEPGIYLVKADDWLPVLVIEYDGKLMLKQGELKVNVDKLFDFVWSERIQPPEE